MQISGSITVEINAEHLAQAVAERVALILREQPAGGSGRATEDFPPAEVTRHRHRGPRFSDGDDGFTSVTVAVLLAVGAAAASVPAWIGAIL